NSSLYSTVSLGCRSMGLSWPMPRAGNRPRQRISLIKYLDMDVIGVFYGLLDDGNIPYPIVGALGKVHFQVVVVGHKTTGPGYKGFPHRIGNRQGIPVSKLCPGFRFVPRIVEKDKTCACGTRPQGNPYGIQIGTVGKTVQDRVQNNLPYPEGRHILGSGGVIYIKKA